MRNTSSFQKFLNRTPIYLVMYGHVEALRLNNLLFDVSVEGAIKNFQVVYNLSDDDFNRESARVMYYRMAEDFRDSQKSDNGGNRGQ